MNNAMLENNCSEQASRMSAMESSTKNAKEMLERLTLSYNRYDPARTMRLSSSAFWTGSSMSAALEISFSILLVCSELVCNLL